MKFLQKLGKALMLPVACLPICGILMGIGYALCPATMQGGDITGIGNQIGFFLVKAGAAGIIRPGKGNIQVIIGPKVQFVADEMEKLCK